VHHSLPTSGAPALAQHGELDRAAGGLRQLVDEEERARVRVRGERVRDQPLQLGGGRLVTGVAGLQDDKASSTTPRSASGTPMTHRFRGVPDSVRGHWPASPA
jgi:hypothetical protein